MQLDERLEKDQKKKNKRMQQPEDEETMDYLKRERTREALNDTKGVFASSLERGINTEKSVFDQQALFFTTKN